MSRTSLVPFGVLEPVHDKAMEVIRETGDAVTHTYGATTVPDHNNRRCVDFMVGSIAAGNLVAEYLIRNHARLGVLGIIWNRQVMGFPSGPRPPYRGPAGVWRPYRPVPGIPYSPHTDHPHVEFNAAPYVAPAPDPARPDQPNQEDDVALSNEDKAWLEKAIERGAEVAVQRALWTDVTPKGHGDQSFRNLLAVMSARIEGLARQAKLIP